MIEHDLYPIEEFDKGLLLDPSLQESELLKLTSRLHRAFTSERSLLELSLYDQKHVSAYTYYYSTLNQIRIQFLLDQLPPQILSTWKSCPLIEVGSGPGTFLRTLKKRGDFFKTIISIEPSKSMRDQFRKISPELFQRVRYANDLKEVSEELKGKSLMVLSFSFNEIGPEKVISMVKKIQPRYLCLIDRGTQESFKSALVLRQVMLDSGAKIIYPCPTHQGPCAIERSSQNWCHQVVKTLPDRDIERFSQKLGLSIRSLAMIGHLYSWDEELLEKEEGAQLLSFVKKTKHSLEFDFCEREGPETKVKRVSYPLKKLSKSQIKEIKNIHFGQWALVNEAESHFELKALRWKK